MQKTAHPSPSLAEISGLEGLTTSTPLAVEYFQPRPSRLDLGELPQTLRAKVVHRPPVLYLGQDLDQIADRSASKKGVWAA